MNNTKTFLPAALALLLSGGAVADTTFQWQADDLATADRMVQTHQRIETTARNYCRELLFGTRDMTRRSQCLREVAGEMVSAIDDPRLTAYAKTGRLETSQLARR